MNVLNELLILVKIWAWAIFNQRDPYKPVSDTPRNTKLEWLDLLNLEHDQQRIKPVDFVRNQNGSGGIARCAS